jgi:hypothetical protein
MSVLNQYSLKVLFFVFLFSWTSSKVVQASPVALSAISDFFNQPELIGPDNLCIIFGSAMAEFSGAGNPVSDVYTWSITHPNGSEHFARSGGATFQNIVVTFSDLGVYVVNLSVRRGNDIIFTGSKNLSVIQGPTITIKPDYLLCGDTPTIVTAVDPNTPNLSQYTFEWTNSAGDIVGNQNELTVSVEGYYYVTLYLTNQSGARECTVNGGTFVGQPQDFRLSVSDDSVCMGSNVTVSLDTPLEGEWEIQKVGVPNWSFILPGFGLDLDTEEDLDGPGIYRVIFRSESPQFPNCISQRDIYFTVTERPDFVVSPPTPSTDCTTPNGSFSFTAISALDELRISELALVAANLAAGEVRNFSGLYPGIYTIETRIGGCARNEVVIVPNSNPPADMQFTVDLIGESCLPAARANGMIRVTFLNGPFTGSFRLVDNVGTQIATGNISNQTVWEFPISAGDYALEFIVPNGCKNPAARMLTVPRANSVSFSVPDVLTICGPTPFVPATTENLRFTLVDPNGVEATQNAGDPFQILIPGTYTLTGISLDNPQSGCTTSRTFNVVNLDAPNFEPILASEDCFGNKVYRAELFGANVDDVSIRWYDENFNIVGRGETWFPVAYANFYLDVQPRGSVACAFNPKPFTVRAPVFEVPVTLTAGFICPGQAANVILETDFDEVERIEWIYIDPNNNQVFLTQFENERAIAADLEGTYEVAVFNRAGCEIGRNMLLVLESLDDVRPEVQPAYSICTESGYGEIVRPGTFVSYEWYRDGDLVSTDAEYNLRSAGNYTLIVTNSDGCSFEAEFSTFEDCTFQFVATNAMELRNPNKQFEVYVNDAVEQAEIWIHNRNGQLVHYCQGQNVQSRVVFCPWDGTVNGKFVPLGSYTATFVIKSNRFGLEKKFVQKLVILD